MLLVGDETDFAVAVKIGKTTLGVAVARGVETRGWRTVGQLVGKLVERVVAVGLCLTFVRSPVYVYITLFFFFFYISIVCLKV